MIYISITDEQAHTLGRVLNFLRLAAESPEGSHGRQALLELSLLKIEDCRPVEEKLAAELDNHKQIQRMMGCDRDS